MFYIVNFIQYIGIIAYVLYKELCLIYCDIYKVGHVPWGVAYVYIYVAKLQYQVHIESTSATYYSISSTYSGGV